MNDDSEKTTAIRITPRNQAILDQVTLYRMTTNDVLHHSLFDDCMRNAVTKATSRLCCFDYLRSFPLYYPRRYFTLGSRATSLLGLPENRTLPFGPQSLPTEYGLLVFAVMGQSNHVRLTRAEVIDQFPGIKTHLAEQAYCLDVDHHIWELVRVDLGGAADHVARKCEADIAVRRDESPFSALLQEKRFRLVIITTTAAKAAAIQQALNSRLWPDGLLLHVAVVSDLIHLTAGLRNAP